MQSTVETLGTHMKSIVITAGNHVKVMKAIQAIAKGEHINTKFIHLTAAPPAPAEDCPEEISIAWYDSAMHELYIGIAAVMGHGFFVTNLQVSQLSGDGFGLAAA